MMGWNVVVIMFVCVAMNHMGLIGAIEQEIGHPLHVINCVKCSTWWFTAIYSLYTTKLFIASVATAFLLSYLAVWLELLMGFIDSIYLMLYGKIVQTAGADTIAADTHDGDSDNAVSQLSKEDDNRH